MDQHIAIASITPCVDGGRYPVKRIQGERCAVEATVFRDGHETIRVVLRWRRAHDKTYREIPMTLANAGLDLWRATFPMADVGRYAFTIEAWTDLYASWLDDLRKRVEAGQSDIRSELLEGVALLKRVRRRAGAEDRARLADAATKLASADVPPQSAWETAAALSDLMLRLQPRDDAVVHKPEIEVTADRPRARAGAWYEMFVRSQGDTPGKGATLREAERRIPDIRDMGFDVLYLAPVHPIGRTHRKGRNNSLRAEPGDPGSPWAIGSEAGGFDAVEPSLGTIEDFDHFVEAARAAGLEIAFDVALQCSPDHPWVKQHPAWFYRRPDGSIKYAENPPKKYEDVYPLNFDTPDRAALWNEIRRILLFWIGHGVKIFRVDNPHTKPLRFWEWLIREIQSEHPDVLFLAEAFTRPPMMKTLAKLGFSQSYTYFTWRHTKAELTEYLTELTQPEMRDTFRPNFFTNTPDILPRFLVDGGRPAFKMRLVLAATLSPSYGMYSGYELCESDWMPHHAIPGDIEYLHSEKYEIKVRDWNAPGNIKDFIAKINAIRRENPALHRLANLRFLEIVNDQLLAYAKWSPDRTNILIIAVNLNPFQPHQGTVHVPAEVAGVAPGETFLAHDLITDAVYPWSERNFVRLDPHVEPAHVLRVERTRP